MRVLDLALKDLLRSVRSASFLAFGFFVPLLVSGIFYFAFGGLAEDDGGFDLPTTKVRVVNLDEGAMGFSAGQTLLEILQAEGLTDLLQVTEGSDPASARAAVDRQEAGVAVIIPSGFTAAIFEPEGHAAVETYQDPTLILGPSIVAGFVRQFVDGFVGTKIAAQVASEQLAEYGVVADAAMAQTIAMQYADWAASLGQGLQEGTDALLEIRPPAGADRESQDVRTSIISMIMAGMMVFYVFFTGAASAQSLLQEEEAGTLPRLFTTPTPPSAVLGGRIIATLVTLVVQIVVLLVLSALLFRISWGEPLPLALVTLALIILAASFGLFVTSLLRDTRQAGVVYGGVLTLAGMMGMIGIFSANVPGAAKGTFELVSLSVPHGWAVRGYELLLEGGGVGDVLLPVAVMLALGVVFFLFGLLRFRKRFA